MTVAVRPTPGAFRAVWAVPLVLAVITVAFLVLAVAMAVRPVHAVPVGDSSGYRCRTYDDTSGPSSGCTVGVERQLRYAATAGIASGVFGLVGVVVTLGLRRGETPIG